MKVRALLLLPGLFGLLCGCGRMRALTVFHDPLSAREHWALAQSYDRQGLGQEAAAQYKAAVRLDPSLTDAWMALGNGKFNEGNFAAAEKNFRRVLKLFPHHAAANNNLAMVYLARDKKIRRAEALALQALAEDGPLKPYILDTLANIYIRQRRFLQAAEALDKAEAASPAGDSSFLEHVRKTRRGMEAALAQK